MRSQLTDRGQDIDYLVQSGIKRQISKDEIRNLVDTYDMNDLVSLADTLRNHYRQGPITYSRKIFINLINLCRDICSYCTYRRQPNQASLSMLNPDQVLSIAELGRRHRCTEALIVTGESPEQKYTEARAWLKSHGCNSTIEYVDKIGKMILKNTGLLPHTNAGNLDMEELSLLRETNVSMGCMLESSSERLSERGMPHEFAPSKKPNNRIRTLENAGALRMPMTTGLLLGIGETLDEVIDSLFVLRELHVKYGNIQEIIIQNFVPKSDTLMRNNPRPSLNYFMQAVALARIILPDMNIQVPPNLNLHDYSKFIYCGINDWGGISPVTLDYVNPESPWPRIRDVGAVTERAGHLLRARLPIYPEYILDKPGFVNESLRENIEVLSDTDGLVREDYLNWR